MWSDSIIWIHLSHLKLNFMIFFILMVRLRPVTCCDSYDFKIYFMWNNWKSNGQNYGLTTEFCEITLFPRMRLNPGYKIGCLEGQYLNESYLLLSSQDLSVHIVADFFWLSICFLNQFLLHQDVFDSALLNLKIIFRSKSSTSKRFVHHRQELEQIDLCERLQPWVDSS